jgi:hypothetical protein
LRAVAVPELLTERAFVAWVLVAVIMKLPVTVRLLAMTFLKVAVPEFTARLPDRVVSLLTVRAWVEVLEYTLRSPATLEYPICYLHVKKDMKIADVVVSTFWWRGYFDQSYIGCYRVPDVYTS